MFEIEIKEKYKDRILAGDSPFKIAVCEYIREKSIYTNVYHEENKISNFVTTNYDNLFESILKITIFILDNRIC